jgi:hypothetical protein
MTGAAGERKSNFCSRKNAKKHEKNIFGFFAFFRGRALFDFLLTAIRGGRKFEISDLGFPNKHR